MGFLLPRKRRYKLLIHGFANNANKLIGKRLAPVLKMKTKTGAFDLNYELQLVLPNATGLYLSMGA